MNLGLTDGASTGETGGMDPPGRRVVRGSSPEKMFMKYTLKMFKTVYTSFFNVFQILQPVNRFILIKIIGNLKYYKSFIHVELSD